MCLNNQVKDKQLSAKKGVIDYYDYRGNLLSCAIMLGALFAKRGPRRRNYLRVLQVTDAW